MENPESCKEGVKKESEDVVELDERTAQILEEELQAVMIKVWQTLPDEPPSAAEKYVAERLRNEASDDIRNVLGLNVTKRLLNIYNPLIVIVHFTKDPSPAHLKQFMKTYNILTMKRHAHSLNLHVASMSSIDDFDKLCTAKNLRCGDAKVKVKPTYRFTISPAKLKCAFTKQNKTASKSKEDESSGNLVTNNKNDQDSANATPVKEKVKDNLSSNIESKPTVQNETSRSNVAKKQESVQNVTTNKKPDSEKSASQDIVSTSKASMTEAAKIKNVVATPTITSKPIQVKQGAAATKVTTAPKPNQGSQKMVEANKVEATPKSDKSDESPNTTIPSPKPKPAVKNIETKPNPSQNKPQVAASINLTESTPKSAVKNNETKPSPSQNKPQVAVTKNVAATTPKPAVKNSETNIATKPNQNKPQVAATKNVTASTPKSTEKTDKTTNATKANPNQNKPQVAATKKVTATTPKMTVKSDINVNKPKVDQTKVATKKTTEAILKSTKKSFEIIESEEIDENDVMDDEEILALISSGVVLDECSGSDDD